MADQTIRVIALSGSLRRNSFNMAALKAAVEIQPAGMQIEIGDYSRFPVFNEDTEAAGLPSAVSQFRQKVEAADALLISTPEYNYSLPGVLKNTIDWLSRSYPDDAGATSPNSCLPDCLPGRGSCFPGRSQGGERTLQQARMQVRRQAQP